MEQKTKCFDERPILPDKQAASPNKNSRMISADERGQKKMPQRRIIVANFNKWKKELQSLNLAYQFLKWIFGATEEHPGVVGIE